MLSWVDLRGNGGHDARVHVSGHVPTGGAAELLERSEDLATLAGRLAAVTESARGQLVLVRGEAGIGKTALLSQFCQGVGRSVRVLWAACDPLFTPRPLGPLLDVARETTGELRVRVESGAQPHEVTIALMGELEAPAPTVMVLEDIHWADEATLDVLRLLARRLEAIPALLLASYRDEQLHRAHPLRIVLGELPAGGAVSRHELRPLSRDAVARLAEDTTLDPDDLHHRTAGNPFFVTEVLAAGTAPESRRFARAGTDRVAASPRGCGAGETGDRRARPRPARPSRRGRRRRRGAAVRPGGRLGGRIGRRPPRGGGSVRARTAVRGGDRAGGASRTAGGVRGRVLFHRHASGGRGRARRGPVDPQPAPRCAQAR